MIQIRQSEIVLNKTDANRFVLDVYEDDHLVYSSSPLSPAALEEELSLQTRRLLERYIEAMNGISNPR